MPEIFDGTRESGEVDPQEADLPAVGPTGEIPPTSNQQKESTQPMDSNQPAGVSPAPGSLGDTAESSKASSHNPDEYSEVLRNERPSSNPLRAFAPKPNGVSFDSQANNEQILLLLRRHPITQLPWLLTAVFLALAPIIFTMISPFAAIPGRFAVAAVIGWYLLLVGFILESFLTWFFNVYIVTDERIIDVDFLSLIYKNVSAAKIDNIEDVTAVTGGAVQSVFNFGTVHVQTAADRREFEFEYVPQPAKVTRLLNELILQEEREQIEGRVS